MSKKDPILVEQRIAEPEKAKANPPLVRYHDESRWNVSRSVHPDHFRPERFRFRSS
jgi:hypothetical protein